MNWKWKDEERENWNGERDNNFNPVIIYFVSFFFFY